MAASTNRRFLSRNAVNFSSAHNETYSVATGVSNPELLAYPDQDSCTAQLSDNSSKNAGRR
jgi:hypothetical protein